MRWGLSTVSATRFRFMAASKAGGFGLSAKPMRRRFLALPAFALLAGCASNQSAYPSLAIRPAERETGTLQSAPAEAVHPPPPQAELDHVAQLAADARADHQAFVEQVASARPTIEAARGSSAGDDAWAKAEAALADVRAARSKTMVPLADLDRLYVDASTKGEAVDRIAAARDEVTGLVAAEDQTVQELSANLS